jgi:hypothetical protein
MQCPSPQELLMFDRIKPVRQRVVGMMLFALAVACGGRGGDSQRADSSVVADSTSRATGTAMSADSAEDDSTPPPEIDEPLKDISSERLLKHIGKHPFLDTRNVRSGRRKCDDGGPHSYRCQLEITPAAGVRKFDHTKITGHGAIIAKIRNIGTIGESVLGIKPYRVYYWYVEKDAGGVRSFILDLTGTTPDIVARLKFDVCKTDSTHPKPPHSKTAAAFKCCNNCPDDPHAPVGPDSIRVEHTTPPWTTCALGCCYGETEPDTMKLKRL